MMIMLSLCEGPSCIWPRYFMFLYTDNSPLINKLLICTLKVQIIGVKMKTKQKLLQTTKTCQRKISELECFTLVLVNSTVFLAHLARRGT